MERLHELKQRMDDIKNTPEAVVAFQILNTLGMMPLQVAEQMVNIFGLKSSAVMTNVPGPRQAIYFAGERIETSMFWVPQSGRMGLGVSIFSYNDNVVLGIATDTGLVPDPEKINEYFEQEFVDLLAFAQQKAQAPRALEAPAEQPEAIAAPEPTGATASKRSRRRPVVEIPVDGAETAVEVTATDRVADLVQELAVPSGHAVPLVVHEAQTTDTAAVLVDAEPQAIHTPAAPTNGTHVALAEKPALVSSPAACQAMTKSGRPCKNMALPGTSYCRVHQE